MAPHLEHLDPIVLAIGGVADGVGMWTLGQNTHNNLTIIINYKLTFAGMQTFDPRVLCICVVSTPAHFKPSTTGSATTGSTRFREGAALGTRRWRRDC